MSDFKYQSIFLTLLLGVVVGILYVLLFTYATQLEDIAHRTRKGEKILFLVPIVIAFVFSWVHGVFTGQFWEIIGLRAARPIDKK
ncbi:MAG: hypothetical protein ACYDC8_11135 [Gammaproteobacteria bacterium]